MYGAGKNFHLEDEAQILQINSPRENVKGPYRVVYKNLDERWAIVALDWNKEPRLGMRWFWDGGGSPFSSGHATWLIIPPSLSKGILASLPIDHQLNGLIDDFLCKKISGINLKN